MVSLDTIKNEISLWCEKHEEIDAAYLHGSVVRGTVRGDSDIDIAIRCRGEAPVAWRLMEWSGELSVKLKAEVDLGLLQSTNLVYLKEAVLRGERLYLREGSDVDAFIATQLGLYLQFRESRRSIEEAYHG
jgi:predicted nucleotidyltransferase